MSPPPITIDLPYDQLKARIDGEWNKDRASFKSSNDEPTPMGCIEEILDVVPPAFWARDDTAILDPCCGNGNWGLVAFDRMRRARPDADVAAILSQLHFNDTNADRIGNVRQLFGGGCIHVTVSDFLAAPPVAPAYDMVVANPPYARLMAAGARASKNHTLTRDFLRRSLDMLKPDGYLAFLIPDNWMSCADRNDVPRLLTAYQFLHLNIHGAKRWFPKIGSSFTWFVLQKTPPSRPMTVDNCYLGQSVRELADPVACAYVPLVYNRCVQSIVAKTLEHPTAPRFRVETSSDLHKHTKRALLSATRDDAHPWRLIHTPKQTVYAARPHKYQAGPKVFLSTTDRYKAFVDDCGMTQSIAFVRCATEDDARRVQAVLSHPLYVFLNNICRWGNFNNIRILQKFPVPADAADVYGSFGILTEERGYIERGLKARCVF